LNHAVSLCRPGEPHAELEEHSLTTLRDGLSQMAVHTDTGQVSFCHCDGAELFSLVPCLFSCLTYSNLTRLYLSMIIQDYC
jgi:hypothetical protein